MLLHFIRCTNGSYEKDMKLEDITPDFSDIHSITLFEGGQEIVLDSETQECCIGLLRSMPFDSCKAYNLELEENKQMIAPGVQFVLTLSYIKGSVNLDFLENTAKSHVAVSKDKGNSYLLIGNMKKEYEAIYDLVKSIMSQ